jgi:hypothetical protein
MGEWPGGDGRKTLVKLRNMAVFYLHLPESLIQSAPGSDYNMLFTRIGRFSNSVFSQR